MKLTTAFIVVLALSGCAQPDVHTSGSRYLYVWAADPDSSDSDFLAVIDVDSTSPSYGHVMATTPVGRSAGAHHTEHVMPEGDKLFVNGFRSGWSWVIDVSDPLQPSVASGFKGAGPYTSPHSFERTPEGTVLATFQNRGPGNDAPGGLVELDTLGSLIRGSDAADPTDPELRPYSLAISPALDRVVTTTSDMRPGNTASSIQIWRLSDLELLQTVMLPPGPKGDEHIYPAEPRFLANGRTLIVTTFNCGMYLVRGVETDDPQVQHIYTLPREKEECSLPVLAGRYWVQTVDHSHSIVVFDMIDPADPVVVDELVFDGAAEPHWISLEPGGNRIVLTGYKDLAGYVMMLHIDSATGRLSVIEGFGESGVFPGVDMNRAEWPHGTTGPAVPHGAVFARP
jgi:hypothetical protein